MAPQNITVCPHCKQTSKQIFIPIKSTAADDTRNVFASIAQSFAEDDIHETGITVERKNFWASPAINDAVRGIAAGGIIIGYGWYNGIEAAGTIAAGVGLGAVIGLPVLKLWWQNRLPAEPGAKEKITRLKVESQDGNTMFIDEISDRNTIEQLSNLGNALIKNPELKDNFSKAAIRRHCKIGGRRYDAIADEFKRLNYAFVAPNNRTILTPRCRALLKKHSTLPH